MRGRAATCCSTRPHLGGHGGDGRARAVELRPRLGAPREECLSPCGALVAPKQSVMAGCAAAPPLQHRARAAAAGAGVRLRTRCSPAPPRPGCPGPGPSQSVRLVGPAGTAAAPTQGTYDSRWVVRCAPRPCPTAATPGVCESGAGGCMGGVCTGHACGCGRAVSDDRTHARCGAMRTQAPPVARRPGAQPRPSPRASDLPAVRQPCQPFRGGSGRWPTDHTPGCPILTRLASIFSKCFVTSKTR